MHVCWGIIFTFSAIASSDRNHNANDGDVFGVGFCSGADNSLFLKMYLQRNFNWLL